ncbi:MAG: 2-C-methyl-D-erythritol 4-phosphate cytidylyltransferase [Atopobiaceae bacterium]|nr:2-C-methyl-D-erythritol 4-phosphate cytidylyltransferase [Atopobiaceae bacterium]
MSGRVACPEARAQRVGEAEQEADSCAIIAAGGIGTRFGFSRGKQYIELCGLPLASWSVLAFDRAPSIAHIVIVCPTGRVAETRDEVVGCLSTSKPISYAEAGETRQGSVINGLDVMPDNLPLVAIHDAARPLITVEAIEAALQTLRDDATLDGAICASRCIDTLKLVEDNDIVATPDRSFYWCAQTPQCFRTAKVVAAHRAALRDGYVGTDDASLVERLGGRVRCVESPRDNIKVTLPEDLAVAEASMRQRLGSEGCGL